MLTAERLRGLLSYDPSTGHFLWRVKPRPQGRIGDEAGCVGGHGYISIHVAGRRYLAHRLAWLHVHGEWPPRQIDHRNCVKTDNRLSNLRLADKSQNAANGAAHRDSSSGVKGVHWFKQRGMWKAEICVRGRRRTVGVFHDLDEARRAYARAAHDAFGEFARI